MERDFVHKVGTLLQDMGDTPITHEKHSLVITTWVKMWPSAVSTRWKSFSIEKDIKTIKKFLQVFTNFLEDGRRNKVIAELSLWSVVPTLNTKWDGSKPSKSDTFRVRLKNLKRDC